MQPTGKLPPTEIFLEIFRYLEKSDLKSVRLVSRSCSHSVSDLLFDTVYISAHKEDFDVFENLAKHPHLSKCVRHLKYDASQFTNNLSERDYMWNLSAQLRRNGNPTDAPRDSPDPEINAFVELVTGWGKNYLSYNTNSVEFQCCQQSRFVKEGYRKFKEYASRQEAAYTNPEYWDTATRLLGQLTNLDSATIYDQWERTIVKTLKAMSDGEFCRFGSPLNRSWNPVHLHPLAWSYTAIFGEHVITSNGTREFSVMNEFLKGTPRRLKRLGTAGSRLSPESFNANNSTCAGLIFDGFWAYAFIETLSLILETTNLDGGAEDNHLPITGLTALLRSASRLKHLSLSLPIHNGVYEQCYKLSEVFPLQPLVWPALRAFYIGNISVEAAHWMMLLHYRMPELRYLEIAVIELSGASWEEVIECMNHHLKLLNFRIAPNALRYADRSSVWISNRWYRGETWPGGNFDGHIAFNRAIESYVVSGGRHPWLIQGQPDDAFSAKSEKLFASVQRLKEQTVQNAG